ncbi:MAG TPA: alpha/beta hydrolase, partial [Ktedonobacteraceae bacterium]|nr:alpha/beta hydrolase [Ktedonobacteraceae bacterium]
MRGRYPEEEGFIERDGVRIFYEVFGAGEPTVLLLPTWSVVHSRIWKAQVPYLARHCRVITFDGRGNGKSSRPATPDSYTDREFAEDALAVMDATATSQAVLLSLSAGTYWSLLLAAEHPERVAGAIYIGVSYPSLPNHPERMVYSFDDVLDTDEGWAKDNRHYWLKNYRSF